jgi:hypothetical protein
MLELRKVLIGAPLLVIGLLPILYDWKPLGFNIHAVSTFTHVMLATISILII